MPKNFIHFYRREFSSYSHDITEFNFEYALFSHQKMKIVKVQHSSSSSEIISYFIKYLLILSATGMMSPAIFLVSDESMKPD